MDDEATVYESEMRADRATVAPRRSMTYRRKRRGAAVLADEAIGESRACQ